MSTAFAVPYNNASSTIGVATAGTLPTTPYTITLTTGGGTKFPSSGTFRVTISQVAYAYSPTATTSNYTIYNAHMVSGDTMSLDSLSTVEGSGQTQTDRVYNVGDVVELRVTSGTLNEIYTAVNAAGGGTPGGSSGQIQYNSSGAFAGSANLTQGTNIINVVGTSNGVAPLVVSPHNRGSVTAGTIDDVIVLNRPSDSTTLVRLSMGNAGAGTDYDMGRITSTNFIAVVGPSPNNESAAYQVFNDATPNHASAFGGGVPGLATTNDMYFSSYAAGYGGWKETFHSSSQENTTGTHIFIPIGSSGRFGIQIKAASSQTADLQQWQNSSGTPLSGIGAAGHHYMVTQSSGSTPSGTPPAGSLVFDTSNFKLWAYTGSAWKSTTLA